VDPKSPGLLILEGIIIGFGDAASSTFESCIKDDGIILTKTEDVNCLIKGC
jgi:hypothetical protein